MAQDETLVGDTIAMPTGTTNSPPTGPDPSWSEAAWTEVVQNVMTLVQAPVDDNNNNNDNAVEEAPFAPGDLLQLVLSLLVEETNRPGLHAFLQQKLQEMRGIEEDITTDSYELPNTLHDILTVVVALDPQQAVEALVLSNIRDVSDSTTTPTISSSHPKWWTGLLMIAALLRHADLTAFDVHLVATQISFLGPVTPDNNIDDTDAPPKRVRREHGPDEEDSVVFWTLLFVLCCWSLQQCHKDAVAVLEQQQQQSTNTPPPKIRWKRMRSLWIETLQLYQRLILGAPAVAADGDDVALPPDEFLECSPPRLHASWYTVSVALWVEHLLPVGQALWTIFPEHIQSSHTTTTTAKEEDTSVFWHATAVSVATHLAERGPAVLHGVVHHDAYVLLLGKLYNSLCTLDHSFEWDTVWSHPWRVSQHTKWRLTKLLSNADEAAVPPGGIRQDSMDWWTLDRWDSQDDDDDHNNICDDDDDDSTSMGEYFDGIVTTWSDIGLASLAWVHWHEGNLNRPLGDYAPQYEWQTGLPHVAILLNTEEHFKSNHSTKAVISLEYLARGMALLLSLLPKIPPQSLEMPKSLTVVDQQKAPHLVSLGLPPSPSMRPPDDPVGMFELLLNVIILASAQQAPSQPDNDGPHAQIFPSAMEVYLLCKEVLNKYTPDAQLEIVLDNLLSGNCPHPSLRPKILDLLRPLLAQLCSSPSGNDDHEALRMHLWKSLEKMLMGLDRYYQRGQEGQIQDTDDLIDETEYFVSVCAMLQLGWNMMRNNGIFTTQKEPPQHPRSIAAVWITSGTGKEEILERELTLQEFHAVLKGQLKHWLKDPASAPQAPVFRLSLLDNAIEELLNLEDI